MSRTLARDHDTWQSVFEHLSEQREGQLVTIEVLDQDFGDQLEAERMPFGSASYDPKGDMVVMSVGGTSSRWPVVLRHLVQHPVEVDLDEAADGTALLRLVDREGVQTLVRFVPAPAIAPPRQEQ